MTHHLKNLQITDPEISHWIQQEELRQEEGLELIASENYVSSAVLEAQGSILTNKYAEGYPAKRYYGGCEYIDQIEALAIQRACNLFKAEAANVQPHSGSQANLAVYFNLLTPGDSFLGMDLSSGGHLTHGSSVNFSGRLFNATSYGLHPHTHRLDYDLIEDLVQQKKPKILVTGASAYPRAIDFSILGDIAQKACIPLVADIAHIAGLIIAELHSSPIPYATYTTSTTHKTLRGPRGGLILCRKEHIKSINSSVFPGIQGGPLMHVIAAKAVAFQEASTSTFKNYQKRILKNAQLLAVELMNLGIPLVTDGTDNHLLLINLNEIKNLSLTGKDVESWLNQAGITVNRNTIPQDPRGPLITSGIRIGVPAITSRHMGLAEMKQIAQWIHQVLFSQGDPKILTNLRHEVLQLCRSFPIYPQFYEKNNEVTSSRT